MGHTPETFDKPMDLNETWTQCPNNGYDILIANGDFIGAFVHDDTHSPLSRARCERACLCVNACGGYSKVNGEWVKTHERMADPAGEIQRLRAERDRYEKALKEIAKGEGAFSRDPLKHAENVINNSLTIAETALSAKEAE